SADRPDARASRLDGWLQHQLGRELDRQDVQRLTRMVRRVQDSLLDAALWRWRAAALGPQHRSRHPSQGRGFVLGLYPPPIQSVSVIARGHTRAREDPNAAPCRRHAVRAHEYTA